MHLVQLEFAVTAEVILVIAFTWVGIWRIINQQFLVIANLVGNKISAEKHLNKCLFIVGIGSNDYINNYLLPEIYPSSHLYAPSQYATALIDQYSRHLRLYMKMEQGKLPYLDWGQIGCIPAELQVDV